MILLYSAREHFVVPQDFSFKMDIAGHISEINVSHTHKFIFTQQYVIVLRTLFYSKFWMLYSTCSKSSYYKSCFLCTTNILFNYLRNPNSSILFGWWIWTSQWCKVYCQNCAGHAVVRWCNYTGQWWWCTVGLEMVNWYNFRCLYCILFTL